MPPAYSPLAGAVLASDLAALAADLVAVVLLVLAALAAGAGLAAQALVGVGLWVEVAVPGRLSLSWEYPLSKVSKQTIAVDAHVNGCPLKALSLWSGSLRSL